MKYNNMLINQPMSVATYYMIVVLTRHTDDIVTSLVISDPELSDNFRNVKRDHSALTFHVTVAKPASIRKAVSYRKIGSIDVDIFLKVGHCFI